ncbi:MAG: SDR family oxidoreductase [Planctomycetes bacterium]|nr:SDR family oxidoreductase [Planctomycetota bacterium]
MSAPVALVTGASSGIGAAIARRLGAEGYRVLLVARRLERLEALAAELPDAEAIALDLLADDAAARLLERVPSVDVLINNAGFGCFGPALELPAADQAREVRLNCEALTRLTLAYAPGMVQRQRGVVINLASIAGFQPVPYFATYAATKAYVLSLSLALDEELRPSGVRVVAVCPGPVPTEFQAIAGSPDAQHTSRLARRTADEVAARCVAAIRRPKRVVVPAAVHGWLRFAYRFVPQDTVVGMAGRAMRKRFAR